MQSCPRAPRTAKKTWTFGRNRELDGEPRGKSSLGSLRTPPRVASTTTSAPQSCYTAEQKRSESHAGRDDEPEGGCLHREGAPVRAAHPGTPAQVDAQGLSR